ncbi:hypothetical protein [Xylanimonas protaetiae]|uniref:TPM domain-containing protein n=1 Tax=Xylanimonas protaetiae TaxID=2509457 RepID=A0A4V0YGF2_9MICO|nr:hypothetical protein [Xylanimonas protaetiae]QAY71001.1 hypothetical protein ET471_13980 [Xylanimonas protaetiae]
MEFVGLVVIGALVVGGAVVLGVFGRRRDRERQAAQLSASLAGLEKEAGTALVRTDERLRLADDEAGFATAQLGEQDARELTTALRAARTNLQEAFHLQQLLHDEVPDTDEQRHAWLTRIVELCRGADEAVARQTAGLAARREAQGRTPSTIAAVRADAERLRATVPVAQGTIDGLAARYTPAALQAVASNPEQAERLLEFAGRSAEVAAKKLTENRGRDAEAAATAGTEAVHRAQGLLEAVDRFEMDALSAEATLGAMIAESRQELAAAGALPAAQRAGAVDAGIAGLEQALASLPAPGAPADPVGGLTRVRQANTALDDAVAAVAAAGQRAQAVRAQLGTAFDDAERQVLAARRAVDDYRAPVGPEARTRLAEAERELSEARAEADPERQLTRARRAASLAAEASALANRDLANVGYGQPGYGQGGYGYGGWQGGGQRSGGNMLGGILGGMVLGGILDDIGDIFD